MKRFQICTLIVGFLALMAGSLTLNVTDAANMDLVSMLVDSLGVTKGQAKGGAGALFQNAKENLSGDDFQKVSDAVPQMDSYLAAAPEKSSGGGAFGQLSSMAGGVGKLGSLASLTDSFKQLGLDSSMVSKFIPVVLEFVQSKGGTSVAGLLKGLWQ